MYHVTVLGAASASLALSKEAWRQGKALHKTYKDTRSVDKTVRHLSEAVSSLGNPSSPVHEQLKDIVADDPKGGKHSLYAEDGRLWACVYVEVTHCRSTVKALRGTLQAAQEDGGDLLDQAKRQIILNRREADFASIRRTVGVHLTSLQTILQVIAM